MLGPGPGAYHLNFNLNAGTEAIRDGEKRSVIIYGVAIQGTGWVASAHLEAARSDPRCRVVAVGGSSVDSASRFCADNGLDAAAYGRIEDLLADSAVDVVVLATPNDLHASETVLAAQAGKHILIEKPAALDTESLDRAVQAVAAAGVTTLVGFVLHWNPMFDLIRAQIDKGLLGRIFYGEINYWHEVGDWYSGFAWAKTRAAGGNALLCAGCHAVDALRFFTGSDIAALSALATRDGTAHEYPSTTVFVCELASGAIGKVSASLGARMPYQFDVDLLGTEGSVRNNRLYSRQLPGLQGFVEFPVERPDSADVVSHPFTGELGHLFDCLDEGTDSKLNLAGTVNTHHACIAAEISASEGGCRVELPLA